MCSACEQQRLHGPDDWANHPYRGHGYNGAAWTHPDLQVLAGVGSLGEISGEVLQDPALAGESHADRS